MSSGYEWIKPAAQRLSDQRQLAGWRPATVEAASFSSRCMAVLRSLRKVETGLRNKEPACILCTEVAGYLIVWLHELAVNELGCISRMAVDNVVSIDRYQAEKLSTVSIRNHIILAWEEWANDCHTSAVRYIGRALVDTLALAHGLGCDLPRALQGLDLGKRKPGGRHPDTW